MTTCARLLAGLAALLSLVLGPPAAQAQHNLGNGGPWDGFYLGINGGYAYNSSGNNSITGAALGILGGYNLQWGRFLAGIEADYTGTDARERMTVPGGVASASTHNMWSVRTRLGWLPADHMLIYGTVGYGGFDIEVQGPYPGNVGGAGFSGSTNINGVVYGGGVEFMPYGRLLVRAELLSFYGENSGLTTSMGLARVGVGYKF